MRLRIEKLLIGQNRNVLKCAAIFNSIAGVMNAFQSIVFIMIAMRLASVDAAGNLTIAFAIGNLLLTLGKFGVRNYQVTDSTEKYKFSDYLSARKITTGSMLVFCFFYCLFQVLLNHADIAKIKTIWLITMIYLFESYEDVYEAGLQRIGRLDVASIIYIIRWLMTYIFYGFVFVLFRNMIVALLVGCMINGGSCFYLIDVCKKADLIGVTRTEGKTYLLILRTSVVLCLSSFLIMFIVNCPKYIIDIKMTSLEQTCFGIIVMPIFVIELLSNFLYQPYLHRMSTYIQKKDFHKIYAWMVKQIGYIIVLTMVAMLCSHWLGIPVLSFVYHIDLTDYHDDLLLVLIGGGLLACCCFLGVVFTLLRKQQYMLYSYFLMSLVEILFIYLVVDRYAIRGVVISYDITIFLLLIIMLLFLPIAFNRTKKEAFE